MNVKDLLKRIRVPFISEIIIQVIAAKGFNMNVKMTNIRIFKFCSTLQPAGA
jgi:hypothetical protein